MSRSHWSSRCLWTEGGLWLPCWIQGPWDSLECVYLLYRVGQRLYYNPQPLVVPSTPSLFHPQSRELRELRQMCRMCRTAGNESDGIGQHAMNASVQQSRRWRRISKTVRKTILHNVFVAKRLVENCESIVNNWWKVGNSSKIVTK